MSDAKLARMANNIASFFQAYPPEQAIAGIHDHILAFWTPKMRAALTKAVASGGSEFHALVVQAVTQTSHAHNPAEKEAAGPALVGEIGASDAG